MLYEGASFHKSMDIWTQTVVAKRAQDTTLIVFIHAYRILKLAMKSKCYLNH